MSAVSKDDTEEINHTIKTFFTALRVNRIDRRETFLIAMDFLARVVIRESKERGIPKDEMIRAISEHIGDHPFWNKQLYDIDWNEWY